jgi:predicted amidophosphoribosyltransferase
MNIQRCPQCDREFDPRENRCPHCGTAIKAYSWPKILILIIAAIVVFQIYPKLTEMIREKTRLKNIQPVI